VTATAAIAKGSKASVYAWTANITARIAGKLAKSAWFPPMTDEPVRVTFHLDQDSRLVSVFCYAVEHQAAHAGFEAEAGAQLAGAAGDICRETIAREVAGGEGVNVTLETYHDRIEIAIHSRGQGLPAVGLQTFAVSAARSQDEGGLNGQELLSRVDQVLYNSDEGVARTTLVKFLPAHH